MKKLLFVILCGLSSCTALEIVPISQIPVYPCFTTVNDTVYYHVDCETARIQALKAE